MPGEARTHQQAKTHDSQQQVIDEFRSNAGRVGGYFADKSLLLLSSTGARTGRTRTHALAYMADGNRYVVVAARAGATRNPDWYHNLVATPRASVEVGTTTVGVTAHVAEGEEREALFAAFAKESPQVELYQAETSRRFPVVVLTPDAG